MSNKIYILGSGGMAREVYNQYRSSGGENIIAGFLINIKDKKIEKKLKNKQVINVERKKINKNVFLINGIGSPLRKDWILKLEREGYQFKSSIHKSAVIGDKVTMGKDVFIGANCTLTCDITIGSHVIINVNSTLGHDSIINDFVTISPGVNIGGGVKIGEGAFIGIGTSIIQGVKIGEGAFIGAGSVVVNDIEENFLAYGNPARQIRKIKNNERFDLLK